MRVFKITLVLVTAVLAGFPSLAQPIDKGTAWHEPYVTLLDVDFHDTGFHARWEYFHCECGDILVRLEQSAPDGVLTGELLLIDGQVLLARGMVAQVPNLELMMQAPTLMLQTAFALMQRAIPKGPSEVEIDHGIDIEEDRLPVDINTGLANGGYQAPWSMKGRAWRGGPAKRRFEFTFEFSNPLPDDEDNTDRIDFSGGQDYGEDVFPLHEEASMAGWSVQWISKGEETAVPAAEDLTLAAIRAEAKGLSGL